MNTVADALNYPVDWTLDGSSGALVGVLNQDYEGAAVLTPINRQSWSIRVGGIGQTWRQSSRRQALALANIMLVGRAQRQVAQVAR